MATKYQKLRDLIARESAWQGGTAHAWECDAINSAWFLNQLALLAEQAPDYLIEKLIKRCAEVET
jgi:hypothetical protein